MKTAKRNLILTEILAAAALVLFLAFCVKANDAREDVSLDALSETILVNASDPDHMKEAGAMKLKALYGLASNEYKETILFTPASNMDAEEMLIVHCENKEQIKTVEEAMKNRIRYQTKIFESYGVDQMALINKAKVESKGLYCLYICDRNSSKVRDAFFKALSN